MILYLETSNLVKLYVREKDSEAVRVSVEASEAVATSVLAYAEARAAFARKLREQGDHEGRLRSREASPRRGLAFLLRPQR